MTIFLKHGNSHLVPYREEHFEKTVAWLNSPEVYKPFGLTNRVTIESHIEWVKSLKNTYFWAIYEVESQTYCGNLLLTINLANHSAFFQIYLGNTLYRGKKIGESSLIAMINYAFEELDLHRIWLHVFPENKGAIRLYEKLGFVYEGMERESHYNKLIFKNQLRYSILRSEWLFERTNKI